VSVGTVMVWACDVGVWCGRVVRACSGVMTWVCEFWLGWGEWVGCM
jgi:hypothetical protein